MANKHRPATSSVSKLTVKVGDKEVQLPGALAPYVGRQGGLEVVPHQQHAAPVEKIDGDARLLRLGGRGAADLEHEDSSLGGRGRLREGTWQGAILVDRPSGGSVMGRNGE